MKIKQAIFMAAYIIYMERKDCLNMQRHNILLIEDDPEISQMLKTYLTSENFDMVCAFDGEEACRRQKEHERLVARRDKYGQKGARADEAAVVQLCRHDRKPALWDDARRRAEQGREPAAQHVALPRDGGAPFEQLDEHIHQE